MWIRALRIYLTAVAVANLIWKTLQLPLYTIWQTGTLRTQAFAIVHCTIGDLVIALCALMVALIVFGDGEWPHRRFQPVAILAILLGLAYTVFSEWLNVVVRASWAYSERMPILRLPGFDIGVSPLLQWIVVPLAAFALVRHAARNGTR